MFPGTRPLSSRCRISYFSFFAISFISMEQNVNVNLNKVKSACSIPADAVDDIRQHFKVKELTSIIYSLVCLMHIEGGITITDSL